MKSKFDKMCVIDRRKKIYAFRTQATKPKLGESSLAQQRGKKILKESCCAVPINHEQVSNERLFGIKAESFQYCASKSKSQMCCTKLKEGIFGWKMSEGVLHGDETSPMLVSSIFFWLKQISFGLPPRTRRHLDTILIRIFSTTLSEKPLRC